MPSARAQKLVAGLLGDVHGLAPTFSTAAKSQPGLQQGVRGWRKSLEKGVS